MIFSVRKSSLLQFKTKLDVFLAANTREDICDFRIEGSWLERSCVIYAGNTNNIVAQVSSKFIFNIKSLIANNFKPISNHYFPHTNHFEANSQY